MPDDLDRAQENEERFRAAAIAHAGRASRSDQGDGSCVSCGEEIEPARRRAVPHARRCAFCQGQHEQRKSWV